MEELNMKNKTLLINLLGIFTTILMIIVIYIILYLEGVIGPPDSAAIIEFGIITALAIYCKIFWYKSCENKVRTSPTYIADRQALSDEIDNTIEDAYDFDKFIEVENTLNYNKYMTSKCKAITPDNYRLSLRDKLHKRIHFRTTFSKAFFFNRYVARHERKAQKINQLSASRITTGSTCELVDDRNFAKRDKMRYIIFGTVISVALFGLMSIIAFDRRSDVDAIETAAKMAMYVISMLFTILITIISATFNTKQDDYDYMRRIYKILDKYQNYKSSPTTAEKVNFKVTIDMEVKDANTNIKHNANEQFVQQHFDIPELRDIQ